MTGAWMFKIGEEEVGPLTTSQLRHMVDSGKLSHDTSVRRLNGSGWTTIRQLGDQGIAVSSSNALPPTTPNLPQPGLSVHNKLSTASEKKMSSLEADYAITQAPYVASAESAQNRGAATVAVDEIPIEHISFPAGSIACSVFTLIAIGIPWLSLTFGLLSVGLGGLGIWLHLRHWNYVTACLIGLGAGTTVTGMVSLSIYLSGAETDSPAQVSSDQPSPPKPYESPKIFKDAGAVAGELMNKLEEEQSVTSPTLTPIRGPKILSQVSRWHKVNTPLMIRKVIMEKGKSVQQLVRLKLARVWSMRPRDVPELERQVMVNEQALRVEPDPANAEEIPIPGLTEGERLGKPQQRVEMLFEENDENFNVAIQVYLTYRSGGEPLEYWSWNAAAVTEPACAPLLVDQNGRVCEIMLGEEIHERKSQIASGESVLETLVFRIPDEKITTLRLVLPSGVFGAQEVLGFEIPIEGE